MDDAEEPPSGAQSPADGAPNVSLADAAIAAAIGRAAAQGRGPDRAPTLEQLLAAFGEGEATTEARARVAAALGLAGVAVEPELRTAAPGQRLALSTPGLTPASNRSPVLTAVYALGALIVVLGTAFAVSQFLGDDGDRVSALKESTTFTIGTVPNTTTPTATTTATTATSTGTTTTATTSTGTTTTTETTADDAAAKKKAKEAAARKAGAAKRAAAKRTVVVRVEAPTGGTFLCVDDDKGNSLFNGTLAGKQRFEAKVVLLNIGLATTRVTVNGRDVPLSGSPTGLSVSRSGVKPLPSGQRPCA